MKPALLLLHGALGASQHFDPILATLNEQYTIHRFNFYGHGHMPVPPEGINMTTYAQQLLSYIQANELAPVAVFGYSMGGYAALTAALQRPDVFLRILTLATKFNWTTETAVKEAKMLDPAILQEKVPAYSAQLKTLHGEPGWEALLTGTAALMQDLGRHPPLTSETFKNISIPVRLMVGDRDVMVSMEETIAAYRSLPNASLAILPDTKHPLDKADPAVLVREILSFMNDSVL